MGTVINLRDASHSDSLFLAIRDDALAGHGCVDQPTATLTVTVEQWRKTARAAARELRRPVRTVDTGNCLHAVLTDCPRDPAENAAPMAAQRAAVEAITY